MMQAATPLATAKFILPVTGNNPYDIYLYVPKTDSMPAMNVTVFNGYEEKSAILQVATLKVLGQTSGEWQFIGTYELGTGNRPYLQLSANGGNGKIIADAVLLRKNILRGIHK
ncbi:hypothetical protein KRR40_40445 [Niabella defluvii]|nr:hypothetical protein KRR40_40445 [Niabella sp. I65]